MGILQIWILQMTFWVSGAIFSCSMEKRERFGVRAGIFAILAIVEGIIFQLLWGGQMWLVLGGRVVSAVLMVIILWCCWQITWTVSVYNAIWGMSVWQLALELWKVARFWENSVFIENVLADVLLILGLFGGSFVICACTIARWMPKDRKKKIGPKQLSSAILIFLIIEMLAYSPTLSGFTAYNEDWKFLYLSQLMCLVILYLQNELFKKSEMKQELALMNLLWKKEQDQYQLTKENIALINQKSHDLKHQIRALRKASKEELDTYLDEMEDSVRIYEAIVKTGNDVFDTILTEKSLYCKDRGIQVSCVADGSQMDFINTVDLYAILGNAMDNAIEAVEKFDELEKRQIDVMIYRQQNFLVMNIINPIDGNLIYEGEFPVTTKGDKKFHGYGLRSIKYILNKYDGVLNISEEDGCFSLKILIPIPNEQ